MYPRSFSTSVLGGSEWSASQPGRFIPSKEPQYPLSRRLNGSQSQSENFFRKEVSPAGIRTHSPAARSLATMPATLSRVRC